jgi:hypothetical protein
MRISKMLLIVPVLVLAVAAIAAGNSPFAGNWKYNASKSKMGPSDTTKSDVMSIKSDGKTLALIDEVTDAQGVHKISVEDAKFDGKDYPVKGDMGIDAATYQLNGPRGFIATTKAGGTTTAKYTIVVSEDGQTLSLEYTAYLPDGKTESGTSVFDKQP